MPVTPKQLYLAANLEELNKLADIPQKMASNANLLVKAASKIFKNASEAQMIGDEEKAYVLYMKFLNVYSAVKKSKEFLKDKKYFMTLIGENDLVTAITEAEKISDVLKRRYEEREAVRVSSSLAELSLPEIPDLDVEKTILNIEPELPPLPSVTSLSPEELYAMLNSQDASQTLLIDVRSIESYSTSHIKVKNIEYIHIPSENIKPPMLVKDIQKILQGDTLTKWESRHMYSKIVLLDWDSKYVNLKPSVPIQAIKDAMYKWDQTCKLKSEPAILEGGYESWVRFYPAYTTNASILTQKKIERTEMPNLNFEYPAFDDDSDEGDLPSEQELINGHTMKSAAQITNPLNGQSTHPAQQFRPTPNRAAKPMLNNFGGLQPVHSSQVDNSFSTVNKQISVKPVSNGLTPEQGRSSPAALRPQPQPRVDRTSKPTNREGSDSYKPRHAPRQESLDEKEKYDKLRQQNQEIIAEQQRSLEQLNSEKAQLSHLADMKRTEVKEVSELLRLKKKLEAEIELKNNDLMAAKKLQEQHSHPPVDRSAKPVVKNSELEDWEQRLAELKERSSSEESLKTSDYSAESVGIANISPRGDGEQHEGRDKHDKSVEETVHLAEEAGKEQSKTKAEEMHLQQKLEEQAIRERERLLSELKARKDAARLKVDEERQALEKAKREREAKKEAERMAVLERQRQEKAEQEQKIKGQQIAREKADQAELDRIALEKAEQERNAQEEVKKQLRAREQAEQGAREQAEQRAREQAEQRAREQAEQRAREQAEQRAREQAELKAQEQAELKAQEQAEQRAREQAERERLIQQQIEREQRAREQAEREQRAREQLEKERRVQEQAARFSTVNRVSSASVMDLPPGWQMKRNPNDGRVYYTNHATGETTFTRPATQPAPVKPNSTLHSIPRTTARLKETTFGPDDAVSGERKQSIKRFNSQPNLTKLDDDAQLNIPSVNRTVKPTPAPRIDPNQFIPQLDGQRLRNLEPAYGSVAPGLCGLYNMGNTCYMNSSLQCLSHTPELNLFFRSGNYAGEINKHNRKGSAGRIVTEFAYLLKALWVTNYEYVVPRDFKFHFGQVKQQYDHYKQMDSQEFLIDLLDSLHEDMNIKGHAKRVTYSQDPGLSLQEAANRAMAEFKSQNQSIIGALFQGLQRSRVHCHHCGHTSHKFDIFNCLPLEIPSSGRQSVNNCLHQYLKEERPEDYKCDKCNKRGTSRKNLDLWQLPSILIIFLKRFKQNMYGQMLKRTNDVAFDLEFQQGTHPDSQSARAIKKYKLYAVINHSGTLESGHYWALCKNADRNGHETWYKFNDERVSPVRSHEVQSPTAYVLFYSSTGSKVTG